MEQDERNCHHSGISNIYYGGVTNVINLKITEVKSSGNQIGENINNIIKSLKTHRDE